MLLFGIDKVAPWYFFSDIVADINPWTLHVTKVSGGILCKVDQYDDPRAAVDPDAAIAAVPATLLGHILPGILVCTLNLTFTEVSSSTFKNVVVSTFVASPIIVSNLTKAIFTGIKRLRRAQITSPLLVEEPKTAHEELPYSSASMVKDVYAAIFAIQASQHLISIAQYLWSLNKYERFKLIQAMERKSILNSPLSVFKLSTITFGLYTVWDLRTKGYITTREAIWAAVTFGLGHGCVGIGADYTGLWWWRECVLERAGHYSRA